MAKRIGPRMHDVVWSVTAYPGKSMLFHARRVGPHGSLQYGYRTVWRAVKVGLVKWRPGPRGSRLLYPAD